MNKGLLGVLIAIAVIIVIAVSMYASYSNAEVRLRNQAKAQQRNLAVIFDQTWKIIAQQAQVKDDYRDSFKEIYPALMEGRYGNARGGALMSWIQESNPNFDTSLYAKLMTSIEAQRINFGREQTKLLDIKREHDNLRQSIPSSIFVGSRPEIEVQLVTSTKTEEIMQTGKEDDINLSPRKDK